MATESQQRLMKRLKFTAEDLAANRDGYMSERQKAYWQQRSTLTTIIFRLGQIGFVLLLVGIVRVVILTGEAVWLALVGGLMGLAVLWTLGDLLNPATDYRDDLRRIEVDLVCGKVKRTSLWNSYFRYPRHYFHKIQVEAIEFRVNGYRWSVFQHGKQYCIYYMPNSKIILSAEEIG